ncbi:hypothetical protein [Prescottella subtropica]|uniref:hypothetical protein n=1 Tax=Prescottella subtropica TaxID=2545757 RepID=UPI0010F8628A|nr:hypothetical protein [Prescottella subtropica]
MGELADRVRQAREEMHALARTLAALAVAYDELPTDALSDADRAARLEMIDSLSDVQLALGDAGEPFAGAVWNADRLARGTSNR